MTTAIEVERLRKVYPQAPGLRDAVRVLLGGRLAEGGTRPALDELDLRVESGESLGVIGRNGSGKTSLLRILSGGLRPSSGSVRVRGRIAALVELGAGIDPIFSGRENALLLGVLAGSTRVEVRERLEQIRDFSGLGDAFDAPVETYSSGMVLRLAFSSIVASEPEVLLVDEVLAVGDAFFQQRCLLRVRQLQDRGCTVVLVSHDPSAILGFCDQAIWLEHGRAACSGEPAKVVREYLGAQYRDPTSLDAEIDEEPLPLAPEAADSIEPAPVLPNIDARHGDGRARIEGIAVRDDRGRALASPQPGVPLRITITLRAVSRLESPLVGFSLRNRLGEIVAATNTAHERHALPPIDAGERMSVEFRLIWPPFASGSFSLSPAVADGSLDRHHMNDWVDNAIATEVDNPRARYGWIELEGVAVRFAFDSETRS